MELKKGLFYIGVNDHDIDLFEGQYVVPNGMAYNSYVYIDDKIAVFDTVDKHFCNEWLSNLDEVLAGKAPDYLIVSHMEPDHSACILEFANKFPEAKIVSNSKSFVMMNNFLGTDFSSRQIAVSDGSELSLGKNLLTFVTAPMVHWPEVIMTFNKTDNTLFSADAFGKFGALDNDEDWACEARRYYFGIVGKYGAQVQALFKKLANLDIKTICPLHGPVLTENLVYYLDLYNTWSSYKIESEGVLICYTSIYGNTKKAVEILRDKLESKGASKVVVNDLARCDMAEAVQDAFRYGKIVLATTTYNNEIFPYMREFINHLVERSFQNKTVGFIENGSWAPVATKVMSSMLEKCKNLEFLSSTVKITSAVNDKNLLELEELANELLK